MRTWITMFRDCHPRSGGILTPKIDKIDGNVEHCHEGKKTGYFRAGRGATGGAPPRIKFFDSSGSGHRRSIWACPGATLARGDRLRLPVPRHHWRRRLCSGVLEVPGGTDHVGAGRAGRIVYSDLWMVWPEFVLAGQEKEMNTGREVLWQTS